MDKCDVISFYPIGHVETEAATIPRHWTVSDAEGVLVVDPKYKNGLKDINPGQKIVVLFYFHKAGPFSKESLIQEPKHKNKKMGVFSICSPLRPNSIGLSVVTVLAVTGSDIRVNCIDMMDGTPIIDIKPYHDADES